jgi:hypothetical protein
MLTKIVAGAVVLLGVAGIGLASLGSAGACPGCRQAAPTKVKDDKDKPKAGCCMEAAEKGKGCCCCCAVDGKGKDAKETEAEIKAARAKLSKEDLALVEAQEFCAVETDNRLGSMGTPFKVTIKGKAVFLCCKGCEKKALADPDKTLAKVKELQAKVKEKKSGK